MSTTTLLRSSRNGFRASLTLTDYSLDKVSGPRHKGLLANVFSTVDRLETYTTRLRDLRHEKQRGTQDPSQMETVATAIAHRYKAREDKLWDVMREKVDMTEAAERAAWIEKKGRVLQDVMGWTLTYLEHLDATQEGWKEREVRELKKDWEARWKAYADMGLEDLQTAGWILDV